MSGAIQKPCILLGEGPGEVSFFTALLDDMGLSDRVEVIEYGGKNSLRNTLQDLPNRSGFTATAQKIAITRDADENSNSAGQSVEDAVSVAPQEIRDRYCGKFILPDNARPGALEALWLDSIAESPYAQCVNEFFTCLELKGWRSPSLVAKKDKARAQVFLATTEAPDERFRHAVQKSRTFTDNSGASVKWFDFDHPAFVALKQFLRDAFVSSPE